MATIATKINVRASAQDKAVLSRAAKTLGQSLSQFVLETTLVKAHHVLGDNSKIVLNDRQWEEFNDRLDNPRVDMDKLRNLMKSPSVFADA